MARKVANTRSAASAATNNHNAASSTNAADPPERPTQSTKQSRRLQQLADNEGKLKSLADQSIAHADAHARRRQDDEASANTLHVVDPTAGPIVEATSEPHNTIGEQQPLDGLAIILALWNLCSHTDKLLTPILGKNGAERQSTINDIRGDRSIVAKVWRGQQKEFQHHKQTMTSGELIDFHAVQHAVMPYSDIGSGASKIPNVLFAANLAQLVQYVIFGPPALPDSQLDMLEESFPFAFGSFRLDQTHMAAALALTRRLAFKRLATTPISSMTDVEAIVMHTFYDQGEAAGTYHHWHALQAHRCSGPLQQTFQRMVDDELKSVVTTVNDQYNASGQRISNSSFITGLVTNTQSDYEWAEFSNTILTYAANQYKLLRSNLGSDPQATCESIMNDVMSREDTSNELARADELIATAHSTPNTGAKKSSGKLFRDLKKKKGKAAQGRAPMADMGQADMMAVDPQLDQQLPPDFATAQFNDQPFEQPVDGVNYGTQTGNYPSASALQNYNMNQAQHVSSSASGEPPFGFMPTQATTVPPPRDNIVPSNKRQKGNNGQAINSSAGNTNNHDDAKPVVDLNLASLTSDVHTQRDQHSGGTRGPQRSRFVWTEDEKSALNTLIQQYYPDLGWSKLKAKAGSALADRTAEDLRFKARNMKVDFLIAKRILPDSWEAVKLGDKEIKRVRAAGIEYVQAPTRARVERENDNNAAS